MISVITPTHDPRWLQEAMHSLLMQDYGGEWEWVVVPNGGCEVPEAVRMYERARVVGYADDQPQHVGALKLFACEQARGSIIVELDHDDMLAPNALDSIKAAFAEVAIDFVYSNHAEFWDGTWAPHVYDEAYGWETRERTLYGHMVQELRAFPPTAQSMMLVHHAPNHVRAWRAEAYWDVGGHDAEMLVCDDHDLCCRFYLSKRMRLLDECLYLYRLHGDGSNAYLVHNEQIQRDTRMVQDRYLYQLVERWADLHGHTKVDLGSAHNKPEGYIGVDIRPGPGVDIVHDVATGLPFDDSSVGVVRAFDFLEHVADSVGLMNEIWRVLVDGGWLLSVTPSTDGRGAFQDPTHCSWWNENSFLYYTSLGYAAYVPEIGCRFQRGRLKTVFPSDVHRRMKIPYVWADLTAVKTWKRRPGLVEI
jgi:SAM-dependent methyltransferase